MKIIIAIIVLIVLYITIKSLTPQKPKGQYLEIPKEKKKLKAGETFSIRTHQKVEDIMLHVVYRYTILEVTDEKVIFRDEDYKFYQMSLKSFKNWTGEKGFDWD